MASVWPTILEAFVVVSTAPEYREKWITARNWATIMCREYNIPYEVAGETIYEFFLMKEHFLQGIAHFKDMSASALLKCNDTTSASSLVKNRQVYVGADRPNDKTPYYIPKENKTFCSIGAETRNRFLSLLLPALEEKHSNQKGTPSPPSSGATAGNADHKIGQKVAAMSPNAIPANPPPPNGVILPQAPVRPVLTSQTKVAPVPSPAIPFAPRPQTGSLPIFPAPFMFQGRLPPAAAAATAPAPPPKPKRPPAPSRDVEVRGPYKGKSAYCDATLRNRAEKMERFMEDCDEATKIRIMEKLLKRKGMQGVREALGVERKPDAEGSICNGIKDFLALHSAQGSRPKYEQAAVDAVMTAVCFNTSVPMTQIGERLGVADSKLRAIHREQVKAMKSTGAKFQPKERKRRRDCYREEAFKCVSEYIHSDEASHLDTVGKKRVYSIKHPFTKEVDSHPGRVWNVNGSIASRFQTFLQSQAYADFQEQNGGNTISKEVFRLGRCGCIRDPRPEQEKATTHFEEPGDFFG